MKPSSQMLALLGLLAVAGYQYRDKLGSLLGGLGQGNRPEPDERMADRERYAEREAPSGGGLGGLLGGLFGGGAAGGLGGLFGGSGQDGGGIAGGLRDLIDRFTGAGEGDIAKSWVERGPNRDLSTTELERALGEDSIDELIRQTGLSREELIMRLKTVLPTAVDRLTPEGRLPTESETQRWLGA